MISIDRVFHTSNNLRQLLITITFIHNLKNKKARVVIVRYLAEVFQLMHLKVSAKVHMLIATRQMQRETVLRKIIGSRYNLKNAVA